MAVSTDGSDPSKVDRFLADRPLDGRRHELIDGTEVKSPALPEPHQAAMERLAELLRAAAPAGLATRTGGVDWGVTGSTVVGPHLLVVDEQDLHLEGTFVRAVPRLVVEGVTPYTAMATRTIKWALYERSGVPAYWLFEPDVPRLMVLEREGDDLVERVTLTGEESADLTLPFPVTVSPAKLL
jgi:Uma2 family endonuclease